MHTSRSLARLAALSLFGLAAACGDQTLVAGLFVNTPAITISIVDPVTQQPTPMTFGPYSAVLGYLTTIDTSDITDLSSASITPITGAQVTLSFESCIGAADPATCTATGQNGTDRFLTIPESGGGLYELISTDPAASMLTYEVGVTYTMIMQTGADAGNDNAAYGARFQPGPPAHMVEFADKTQPVTVTAGETLTVHRDDAKVNGEYLPAAIIVGQIDPMNPGMQPMQTWTSFDYSDPQTLALFALGDSDYRVDHIDIDPSAFPASGYYVVTMISITEGPASANAFIGSVALAGSGDAGLVIVQ